MKDYELNLRLVNNSDTILLVFGNRRTLLDHFKHNRLKYDYFNLVKMTTSKGYTKYILKLYSDDLTGLRYKKWVYIGGDDE